MSAYVDDLAYHSTIKDPRVRRLGLRWCHLFADTLEELHDFAQSLGMRRAWFQDDNKYPHYDLTISRRLAAIKLGAVPIATREWIRRRKEE